MDAPTVNLTLAGLQSFHGMATQDDDSVYSSNGHDSSRIREALKTRCNCTSNCWIPFALLLKICTAFWKLSKGSQDAILWSLQTVGGRGKCKYSIEGHLAAVTH